MSVFSLRSNILRIAKEIEAWPSRLMEKLFASLNDKLQKLENDYAVAGVVDTSGKVYPLGADTKVLSTIFELICRPSIYAVAQEFGLTVAEADVQNVYPDFTLMKDATDGAKIAIDVKTTYRNYANAKFAYTLGGYSSFMRGAGTKSILYPFDQYQSHWVIGFVYERRVAKKSAVDHVYDVSALSSIPLPFANVECFLQEKWRVSSDKAGSGNTTNIASIRGTIADFEGGNGVFTDEEEFLRYWRGYEKTAAERKLAYKNIDEFRRLEAAKTARG